jgi:hypothetical protein
MLDIGIQLRLTDSLDVRASLQNCNGWQDKFSKKSELFPREFQQRQIDNFLCCFSGIRYRILI